MVHNGGMATAFGLGFKQRQFRRVKGLALGASHTSDPAI
jgi:hypothetical protein